MHFFDGALGPQRNLARIAAVLDDEDDVVDFARDDGAVADAEDGWRVDEDEVVALLEVVEHVADLVAGQDADFRQWACCRRARQWSLGIAVRWTKLAASPSPRRKLLSPSFIRDAEEFVQRGAAQIAVDEDDRLAGLGADDGKIEDGGRLALSRGLR